MTEQLYRAQEFGQRAGVTVRTLHLYDRLGLLPPAQRTAGGYRLYGQAQLERLEQIVRERRRQLDNALAAIERAANAIEAGDSALWDSLRTIIEVMKMEKTNSEWTKKYYTPQAQEKLEQRRAAISRQEIDSGQQAWSALIAEVEAAKMEDPAGPHAQELAKKWKALVAAFTGGDPEINSGLNRLWSDQTHWPQDFKRPWSDDADRFIHAALQCGS